MKQILSFIMMAFCSTALIAQAPITVTIVSSEPGSGVTNIEYVFSGTYLSYDITVEVSFDGGAYQPVPGADLSGDLTDVAPGTRNIVWNGAASFPDYYHEQTRIRITATPNFTCGDQIMDVDGNTYNTVLIGTQCWMAENLNVGTRIDGTQDQANNSTVEKYCYGDDPNNCDTYGGLYQWAEMVQYLNGATNTSSWNPVPTGNVQGICPDGWHVPSDEEWKILEGFADTQYNYPDAEWDGAGHRGTDAGGRLKSISGWFNNGNGTDNYGFSGLPGGSRSTGGLFSSVGRYGYWWPSTEYNDGLAWSRSLLFSLTGVSRGSLSKAYGFSVRCLRDN